MSDVMYPEGVLGVKIEKASVQSYLFGHRIKPQQTCYEYLSEFLQIALAPKRPRDRQVNLFPQYIMAHYGYLF